MKKWEKFSREEIERFVKESKSNREVARKIGYDQDSGTAMKSLREMYDMLEIDTSHFTGQGWNKDNYNYARFTNGKRVKSSYASRAIIALRGHKCECCGNEYWNGQPIPLQVHHTDGDSLNNDLTNLQLLCPNCHAQTENYCGKNMEKRNISDEDFVDALRNSSNIYQALIKLGNVQGRMYQRAYKLIEKYDIKF